MLKIVSDGDFGAASGALAAALNSGLKTGGWITKGYLTSRGETPGLKFFDVKELNPDLKRTEDAVKENILKSDGTVCFITNVKEVGVNEEFVRNQCYNRAIPILVITLDNPQSTSSIRIFVEKHKIQTLHVSGVLDKPDSKLYHQLVYDYMKASLKEIKPAKPKKIVSEPTQAPDA